MGVADQKMDAMRPGTTQHIQAQQPDACATIQNKGGPIRGLNLNA